ncbi:MAG TPA: hypothetical protein VM163_01190 [bacterium]|nr:hypothetical protein [bacterium]
MGAHEVKQKKTEELITVWEKLKTENGSSPTSERPEFRELHDYTVLITDRMFGKKAQPPDISGAKTVAEAAELHISKLKALKRFLEAEAEIEKAEEPESIIQVAEIEEPKWIKDLFDR